MLTKIIALFFKQQHWGNIELSALIRWKDQYPQSELMYLLYIKKKYFSTAEAEKKVLTLQQSDEREKEIERLYLFFDNPLWIQFLLSQKTSRDSAPARLFSKKNKPAPKSSIKAISKEMLPSLLKDTQQKASELQRQKKRAGSTAPKPQKTTPQPLFSEEKKTAPPLSVSTAKVIPVRKKAPPISKPPASEKPQSLVYWLKKSKKITGGDALLYVEEKNEDTDIYTQTMAKLYEKQGKIKEAIRVYEKLILQNPSKNALFAKKIEALKKKL